MPKSLERLDNACMHGQIMVVPAVFGSQDSIALWPARRELHLTLFIA